ncbi:MAG: PEP-CTERM sorting domain-containing protein [Pseudomonadota bacterium]
MHLTTIKRAFAGVVGTLVLMLGTSAAHAITYDGSIVSGAGGFSLTHGIPVSDTDPDDWLRFADGDAFTFDVDGLTVTAGGPQTYTLTSNNGAMAEFVLLSMMLELDDTTGIPSGTIDYTLDGVAGTFTFLEQTYGDTDFNSSSFDGSTITVNLWGADDANGIGLDLRFTGSPVPVPPALWLFGSAVAALAMRRRSQQI